MGPHIPSLYAGAMHGACMVVERIIYGDKIKTISDKFSIANLLRLMVTFSIVNFAWIFFRVNNLVDVMLIFKKIFSDPGKPFLDTNTLLMGFIAMAIVFSYDFVKEKHLKIHLLSSRFMVLRYVTAVLMIAYILAFGVLNGRFTRYAGIQCCSRRMLLQLQLLCGEFYS